MGPQRLKLLAVSDTHLGEETSLLSFPRGLQHLWTTLREDPAFWKPFGPRVPRRRGAREADGKAHDAERQGVLHRPVGREPRRDVAARNSVDDAVRGRE